jgi:hypothetical protein
MANHCVPEQILTDNGKVFTGIRGHVCSAQTATGRGERGSGGQQRISRWNAVLAMTRRLLCAAS